MGRIGRYQLNQKHRTRLLNAKNCYQELKVFKQAMDQSRTTTWESDYRQNTIKAMDTWVKVLGYQPEEVQHSFDFFLEAIHPEDKMRTLEARQRHFRGEIPEFHVVFRMKRKDDSFCWIRTRGKVVEWDRDGNVLRMVGIHEDITRSRKMVERLQESEQYYQAEKLRSNEELRRQKAIMDGLFRTSPDALVLIDREGIIQRINQQFTVVFQYAPEEAVGKHIDELITSEEKMEEATELNSKSKILHHLEVETERTRKNGTTVPILIRSQPCYLDDQIIGHQILYTDITQRKQEEEALLKVKEEADAAHEAKSRFLSNISHEMRTPMNGICGASILLENTELNEEQKELLHMLKESSDRMMNTVADMLDLSRIERGNNGLREEEFDLCQSVINVVEPFKRIGEAGEIDFSIHCDESAHMYVLGDRGKLCRIIYHLISNAFKFTSEGTISIQVKLQECQHPIGIFRFRVEDTGIGINAAETHQLFDSFTQLDDSSTKSYQGSGLGLAIVHKLLERMGGTVHMDSSPSKGTSFYFDLPLKILEGKSEAFQMDLHKENGQGRLRQGLQILAVEDDEISQILLKKLVQKIGAQMDIAPDGLEAIQLYGQKKYDLVLMDVQLPSISGLEVTEVIRSFEARMDDHTPIIGISAHAMGQDREKCMAAGMDDYMSKPIDFNRLVKVMEKCIQS